MLLRGALPRYLHALDELLAPEGRYVFLENANGGIIFALIRCLRYRQLRPSGIEYFTPLHLRLISEVFGIREVKKSYFPPIYLIMGRENRVVLTCVTSCLVRTKP